MNHVTHLPRENNVKTMKPVADRQPAAGFVVMIIYETIDECCFSNSVQKLPRKYL